MSSQVFPMCKDCCKAANQIPSSRIEEDEPRGFSFLCDVCGKMAEVYGTLEALRGAFLTYTSRLREALQKAQQG